MNPSPELSLWLRLWGVLAVEVTLVVALAAALHWRLRSAEWRRTVWQGCIGGLGLLLALELGGSSSRLGGWTRAGLAKGETRGRGDAETRREGRRAPERVRRPVTEAARGEVVAEAVGSRVGSPLSVERTGLASEREAPKPMTPSATARAGVVSGQSATASGRGGGSVLALAGLWMLGSLWVAGRLGGARVWFWWRHRRDRANPSPAVRELAERVAGRIGLRRTVRLMQTRHLPCPVAFGWVRPRIGLPADFERSHPPAQQEVMLAHELAHLVARDPVWHGLADLVAAALWWHPVVWWARRQLHAASEAAADEACLLVTDGPAWLAEALLAVGERLTRPRLAGWVGMGGNAFRSGLGRRVARLVTLRGQAWRPPQRWRTALAPLLAPLPLALVPILCAALTVSQPSNAMIPMKNTPWKQSLMALAVVAALDTQPPKARAVEAAEPPPPPRLQPPLRPVVPVVTSHPAAQALRDRLEKVVVAEVQFDNLPLAEVVKSLSDLFQKTSPDKTGVNFLFSRRSPPLLPVVDPAPGAPPPPPVEAVDLASVTIRISPPLRNVRAIDVLEAVVEVAERPIKYTIEPYAVVFALGTTSPTTLAEGAPLPPTAEPLPPIVAAPAPPSSARGPGTTYSAPTPTLQTRVFQIGNVNEFFRSATATFGTPDKTDTAMRRHDGWAELFAKAGVRKEIPALYYNETTHALLVRAPSEDMELIQATIQLLGGSLLEGGAAAVRPPLK